MIARTTWINSLIPLLLLGFVSAVPEAVAQTDRAQDTPPPSTIRVYYLRFIKAEDAVNVIQTLFQSNHREITTNIAYDLRSNSIIVSGIDEVQEQVSSLIESIDTQTPERIDASETEVADNVQVEVYWLADADTKNIERYGDSLRRIPGSIAELVESKLKARMSLENPQLVSRVFVHSSVPSAGQGVFEAQRIGEVGENGLIFSTTGTLTKRADGLFTIDLQLQVGVGQNDSLLSTTIATKPDHPVCLALARTGDLDSLFIVRLSKLND